MKRSLSLTIIACFFALLVVGQEKETTPPAGYQFSPIKELKITPVKDQNRSGTCWSFSTVAFLESELLRMGKPEVDLSEMWAVRYAYSDKATKFVRLQGGLNFGGGGSFADVIYVLRNYGYVPEVAYSGLQYGQDKHVHGELDALLKDYVDGVIKNPNKQLSTAWHKGFDGILDAYLGPVPEKFTYNGKEYSPKSFGQSLGLNPDDYISLTSYTHHPFYSKFILEVPDNWIWEESYNLPLEDLKRVFSASIENGYTIAWGSDVSEKGFSYNNGVAVVPEANTSEMNESEKLKWSSKTEKERQAMLYSFDKPAMEKTITQELRQKAFDNYQTTDDHGMLIYGSAKDQNGKLYYMVKNSWGAEGKYNGNFYASEAFVLYKTMNIMVHKNAIPADIRKKLGI
ncbi:C1 family peptidase [Williamwhitmania taraxaci]|uniref:Aminopeptidase n=1 Tax=Williamwhitmania taraxaci TaxID=1640674 RepID=A0A1G6GPS4_9BACT|nr:C1 family peptidase [Williamwhitmania taraxaci]SDB83196.1 bleomycin hydrolase [Williamwhitmania taraxaci]